MAESSPVSAFAYRAFISYSHADRAWCDWLHKVLETYRVPSRLVGRETASGTIPRRLTPIFRDRDELPSAIDLNQKVEAAMRASAWLIVICSPRSAASRWVNEEVLAFKRMGRADRILCLIVDGEPNAADLPGRESEECFCPALRHRIDANGAITRERTEPIAADARAGKDGKANAKLKLIAGMLDVGFDALKQRELQRRNRRMAAITALALIVMAVTITLAVFALISRHNAVIAQHQADVAKQAAERRQKQAEDLVGFMLGDLNDKLQQVSRLDIMRAVDDQAMAYFESLPPSDVSDSALTQRAKALEKIGNVRMDQGQLSGAMEAFRASTRISAQLAAESPANVARQVAYSRTLAFIGMNYWNQSKLDAARHAFEAGQQALRTSRARTEDDPSLLLQRAILEGDLGHVLEAQGHADAAETTYRSELSLFQRLVALKPGSTDYAAQLGDSHNDLGKLALQRGDLATAVAQYRADDAIETRLSERDPRNNHQRENIVRIRAILGRTLALAGDIQDGMRALQQAVDSASQLMKFDPSQTDYQDDVALYSAQLARLQRLNGDLTAANALTAQSAEILSALSRKDPSNSGWQQDLASTLTEQAAELYAANQPDAARSKVQSALRILEPMLAKNSDDRDSLLSTVTARLLLADVSADPQIAQRLRHDALKTMQAQKTGKADPRLLALQVEAMVALGSKAEAQPRIKQLWNSGYRDLALVDVLRRAHIDYPPNPDFPARLLAAPSQDDHVMQPAGKEAHK